jgi:hypothetical protein
MQRHGRILFTVLLPILIGGFTYILFRSDTLIMFRWFDNIGLESIIKSIRSSIGQSKLPSWIIYSLPDALWVFSFTSFMLIIWKDKFTYQSISWILIAPTIGLLSEIGQAFHVVPGTFDITDLTLLLLASLLPFITTIKNHKKQIQIV